MNLRTFGYFALLLAIAATFPGCKGPSPVLFNREATRVTIQATPTEVLGAIDVNTFWEEQVRGSKYGGNNPLPANLIRTKTLLPDHIRLAVENPTAKMGTAVLFLYREIAGGITVVSTDQINYYIGADGKPVLNTVGEAQHLPDDPREAWFKSYLLKLKAEAEAHK